MEINRNRMLYNLKNTINVVSENQVLLCIKHVSIVKYVVGI